MRCKYTFEVCGRVRPAQIVSFEVGDYRFEFPIKNGFIHQIIVSFPISDCDLPTVIKNPKPGIALHIDMKIPRLAEIEEMMHRIQGLWSFWGLESIDIHYPNQEWVAENEEEKQKVKIGRYKINKERLEDHEISPVPFDFIARSVISATKIKKQDVILSFYRRGSNDINNQEYIEAIYDFYFVLESAYGNGKSKNYAVANEFLRSGELRKHIENVRGQNPAEFLKSEDQKKYRALVHEKSVEELVQFIVNTRGFLHHHTRMRKDIWNPEMQKQFKIEACFFHRLCFAVSFDIFLERTYDTEVVGEYEQLVRRHSPKN